MQPPFKYPHDYLAQNKTVLDICPRDKYNINFENFEVKSGVLTFYRVIHVTVRVRKTFMKASK